MPKRNTFFFFCLLFLAITLMTFQSRQGYVLGSTLFSTVLNSLQSATSSLADRVKGPFRRLALREEENRRLQSRVNELLAEQEKTQEALSENKRLRELLKLSEIRKDIVTAARVIARGSDHWAKVLVLDKGALDGVRKDQPVITEKGLAGKITVTSDSYSHLLLLTDINFAASVRLQETRSEGIIAGTGTRKCVLKYIPYEEEVKDGDVVVTSGLDAFFPAGISVGYISKTDKGGAGHFQYIEVTPFQDDAKIEEVLIIR